MITGQRRNNEQSSYLPEKLFTTGDAISGEMYVTIIFTSISATLNVFRITADWINQLGIQIKILVPHVVPYPLPLDRPQVDPAFRLKQFRALCEQGPAGTRIEIKLCRNVCDCLLHSVTPHSLVLIGVRKRWWPFTCEKRWARSLERAGHQIILI